MNSAVARLAEAQKLAMQVRPRVGGFPILAEVLRAAGVTRNVWSLPACQSLYVTKLGPVMQQGTPLVSGLAPVPDFNKDELIRVLRKDQAGESTFTEFLRAAWEAGVVSYDVDFSQRRVTYFGANGESYVEDYPAVAVAN